MNGNTQVSSHSLKFAAGGVPIIVS